MKLNALLDDGSTKTYINREIAEGLGIRASVHTVCVNVLNGKQEVLETMPVTLGIESENRQVKMQIYANTIDNVTGNLQAVDWNDC